MILNPGKIGTTINQTSNGTKLVHSLAAIAAAADDDDGGIIDTEKAKAEAEGEARAQD